MALVAMGKQAPSTTIKHNDICSQYALPFGWFQCESVLNLAPFGDVFPLLRQSVSSD
jgi:hypothetical protein